PHDDRRPLGPEPGRLRERVAHALAAPPLALRALLRRLLLALLPELLQEVLEILHEVALLRLLLDLPPPRRVVLARPGRRLGRARGPADVDRAVLAAHGLAPRAGDAHLVDDERAAHELVAVERRDD